MVTFVVYSLIDNKLGIKPHAHYLIIYNHLEQV